MQPEDLWHMDGDPKPQSILPDEEEQKQIQDEWDRIDKALAEKAKQDAREPNR